MGIDRVTINFFILAWHGTWYRAYVWLWKLIQCLVYLMVNVVGCQALLRHRLALVKELLSLSTYLVSFWVEWHRCSHLAIKSSRWTILWLQHVLSQTLPQLLGIKCSLAHVRFLIYLVERLSGDWTNLPDFLAVQRRMCLWSRVINIPLSRASLGPVDACTTLFIKYCISFLKRRSLPIALFLGFQISLGFRKITTAFNSTSQCALLQINVVFNFTRTCKFTRLMMSAKVCWAFSWIAAHSSFVAQINFGRFIKLRLLLRGFL